MSPETDSNPRVEAVRRFNRFHTRQIGVLQEKLLRSPYSLTEVRVLYELAYRAKPTAAELGKKLGLDAGYLSRILRDFKKQALIDKIPSDSDGREQFLSLTSRGKKIFAQLDQRSSAEIAGLLSKLSSAEQRHLVEAMKTIEKLLGSHEQRSQPYVLRPHQPGDMGWVVHRHGLLYAQEYGWNEQFEALVASIVANFVRHYDPKRERCWIAERDGEILGSVFLVKQSKAVAKLRLLLVEPSARGLGIGTRLVSECVRFARQVGYRKVTLWTNSVLLAARRIYESAGFRLIQQEPHHSFGRDLIGEEWTLDLSQRAQS